MYGVVDRRRVGHESSWYLLGVDLRGRKVDLPGEHVVKTLGDTKVIGPLLIGLGLPIEIAPLRSSTSELINLASIAAYSADVIDYKK